MPKGDGITPKGYSLRARQARANFVDNRRRSFAKRVQYAQWEERIQLLEAATPDLEKAGFNDEAHFRALGAYCACGTVQDHDAKFDRILEEVNQRGK